MFEGLQLKSYQAWEDLHLGEIYALAAQKEKAPSSLRKAGEMAREMGMEYYLV